MWWFRSWESHWEEASTRSHFCCSSWQGQRKHFTTLRLGATTSPQLARSSPGHQDGTEDFYSPSSSHDPPWQSLPVQARQRLVQGGVSQVTPPSGSPESFLIRSPPWIYLVLACFLPTGWLKIGKTWREKKFWEDSAALTPQDLIIVFWNEVTPQGKLQVLRFGKY